MGNKQSKLSPEAAKLAEQIFRTMDLDNSGSIDKQETLKFWKSNYAKINTEEIFKAVDTDKSGTIEFDEWMEFWGAVKNAGHSDKEIIAELESLKDRKAWVSFCNVNPSRNFKV